MGHPVRSGWPIARAVRERSPRCSPDLHSIAAADLPGRQAFADGDRHVSGGLSHVAFVADHPLGFA